jgi:phage-related protein
MINFVKANVGAFAAFGIAAGALAAPLAIAAGSALLLDLRIRAMLAWDKVMKVVKATAVAFRVLTAAMAANPIGLIIAAIGILVGTFMLLWKNNEGFRNFFISTWTQIQKTFGTVTAAISKFAIDTFGGLQQIIKDVTTTIQNLVNAGLSMLNTALQATKQFLEDNRTTLTNIAIVITTLMLPMLMKLGLQFLAAAAQAVISAAQTAGAWIAGNARMAASNALTFAQMSIQFVQTAVTSTIQAGIAAAAWIKNAALVAFAWVTQTLPSLIVGFVRSSAAAVVQAGIAAGAWIMQAGRVLLSWGATFIAYGIGVATAAAQTLLAGARMAAGWLMAMGPIGLIIAAVAGAVALIIANWDTVKNVALTVWNGIKAGASAAMSFIQSVFGAIGGFFRNVFQGAFNIVSGIWNGIGSFFSGIIGKITSAIGDVSSIGRNIIDGIVKGLNPANVVSKMKEIAASALGAVKNFLGIKSPSRVMRDQVGKMIGFGLADGIAASTRTAVKSAQQQSAAVLGAFSTMIGPSLGMVPQMAGAATGAAAGGQSFTIINPNPEETAAIVASRIKTQGGDI